MAAADVPVVDAVVPVSGTHRPAPSQSPPEQGVFAGWKKAAVQGVGAPDAETLQPMPRAHAASKISEQSSGVPATQVVPTHTESMLHTSVTQGAAGPGRAVGVGHPETGSHGAGTAHCVPLSQDRRFVATQAPLMHPSVSAHTSGGATVHAVKSGWFTTE